MSQPTRCEFAKHVAHVWGTGSLPEEEERQRLGFPTFPFQIAAGLCQLQETSHQGQSIILSGKAMTSKTLTVSSAMSLNRHALIVLSTRSPVIILCPEESPPQVARIRDQRSLNTPTEPTSVLSCHIIKEIRPHRAQSLAWPHLKRHHHQKDLRTMPTSHSRTFSSSTILWLQHHLRLLRMKAVAISGRLRCLKRDSNFLLCSTWLLPFLDCIWHGTVLRFENPASHGQSTIWILDYEAYQRYFQI